MNDLRFEEFPSRTFDKVRYADTDRQGHVNNAAFSSFLETGRVEILYSPTQPILPEDCSFVIVSLHLDFLRELHWPGRVEIGTGVTRIGNSSLALYQQLFQHGECVARAATRIVQIGHGTGRSRPLEDNARTALSHWLLAVAAPA